ncbi:MAG: S8 family serine peptidase [Acidobacteria bacterium]|nr:S8 family serine peptidase [Acidobacteriota bacterium]
MWEEMCDSARAGSISPDDLVWHETLPDWVPASTIPGLIPDAVPTTAPDLQATPAATGQAAVPHVPKVKGPKRRKLGRRAVAALVALLLIGGGIVYLRSGGDSGSGLGRVSYTAPRPGDVMATRAWGRVPINQLAVVLEDGRGRGDAERVAKALGGAVIGEMEYVNLYQLRVAAANEAELAGRLEQARAARGVALAFPNQETRPDEEIGGERQSALNEPVYQGENGKPYAMIGVERAWNYLRGAGMTMNDVQVGVVDNGLYRGQDEFGGDTQVETADAGDELAQADQKKDGKPKPYGSHGTAVTGIIAADPGNGGQTGVASVLGKKLKVRMTNIWGPKYGSNTPAAADPNDPTKVTYARGGGTFALGDLQALQAQVEAGSTIINCSWGNSEANPETAAAYRKFFQKMAKDRPDVLFVASAGNDGKALDGTKRYPSGLALPNMITVGALDNDGSRVDYSNMKSDNFEVTLAAPGHRVVSGVSASGEVSNFNGGTSFSTPQVTAAASMMRSLNPKLTAGQIKAILVETAAPGVTDDEKRMSVPVPKSVGAGVLRVDKAVLRVINDLRAERKEPPLAEDFLENLGVIDAVAITGEPGEYAVKGIVKAVGEGGTDVTISLAGEGAIGGTTTQHLDAAGETRWSVTLTKDTATISVRRLDNGAASVITIEVIDLNGHWAGTFTITKIEFAAGTAGKGGVPGLLRALIGKAVPMTLDVTADVGGGGSVTLAVSGFGGVKGSLETGPLQWSGNSLSFSTQGVTTWKGRASREGDAEVITGTTEGPAAFVGGRTIGMARAIWKAARS